LNSIYSPQIIVNGNTQCTGSEKGLLQQTITKELNIGGERKIELNGKSNDNNQILVHFKTQNNPHRIIHIAHVQLMAKIHVARGENEGRVLRDINIVCDFRTIPSHKESIFYIKLPSNLTKKIVR
jgi:hypothetical protein